MQQHWRFSHIGPIASTLHWIVYRCVFKICYESGGNEPNFLCYHAPKQFQGGGGVIISKLYLRSG